MRQKKQAMLIVFSIVLLLFIAGCGRGEDGISKNDPFLGGNKGLVLDFLQDDPPSEITDGGIFPFRVVLSIKNEGEFPLTSTSQIRVNLKGILAKDFGRFESEIKNLRPDSIPSPRQKDSEGNIIEPIETFVTIPKDNDLKLKKNIIQGNTEYLFRADVCYQYGTKAIAKICILENMISVADDAICNPRGTKKVFSSSSPVQVTGFRQTVAGQFKIQFSFDVEHVGRGKVFKDEPIDIGSEIGCPKKLALRREKENVFKLEIDTGITDRLTCVGIGSNTAGKISKDEVRLVKGKRTITCTQDLSGDFRTDLERNIDITLTFDYLDTVDRKILAKHILEDVTPSLDSGTGGDSGVGDQKPLCESEIEGVQTFCRSSLCANYGLTSCGETTICQCPGITATRPCSGTCSTTATSTDTSPPDVGTIKPIYMLQDSSQFFVITDVMDINGVAHCRLEEDDGTQHPMERQGPDPCDTEGCDFVGLMSLELPGDDVKALCTDGLGNINNIVGTERVRIFAQRNDPSPPPAITETATSGTPPEIGELVTIIAKVDEEMRILVTGIQDAESGINSCRLFMPGARIDDGTAGGAPGTDKIVVAGTEITGVFKEMDVAGPIGCRPKITNNQFLGPCTATAKRTFTVSGNALPQYIICKNGALIENAPKLISMKVRG